HALHDHVGLVRKPIEWDELRRVAEAGDVALRLGLIPRRNCREGEPLDLAGIHTTGHLQPDGAKSRYCQPEVFHPYPQFSQGFRKLAQCELLDLARRRLGYRLKSDVPGTLVARQMLPAPLDNFLGGGLRARLQLDEGKGRLTPLLVRLGNDCNSGDRRVLVDRVLDLDGRDVLATRDDDVLGAILELNVAVRVQHAEVTRVEPAARKGFRRRL